MKHIATSIAVAAVFASNLASAEPFNSRGADPFANVAASSQPRPTMNYRVAEGFNERGAVSFDRLPTNSPPRPAMNYRVAEGFNERGPEPWGSRPTTVWDGGERYVKR